MLFGQNAVEVALLIACLAAQGIDRYFPEHDIFATGGVILVNCFFPCLRYVSQAECLGNALFLPFIGDKRNAPLDDGRGIVHRKVFRQFIGGCFSAADPDNRDFVILQRVLVAPTVDITCELWK